MTDFPGEPARTGGPRRRIVLVEDDPDLRQVLAAALRERHDLSMVARGDLALAEVRARRPHLVVLDIHLPGINGFEVCQALRENPDTSAVPVLFLTSRHDDWSRTRGTAMGGTDYLTKPFDMPALLAKIDALAAS